MAGATATSAAAVNYVSSTNTGILHLQILMQNAFGDNLTQQVYLRVFTDKPYNPSSVLILPAQEHESTHRYVYTTFYSSPSDLPGFWPTSGPVIAVKYFGNDNNGTLVVKEPPFHMTVRLVTLDDVAPLCSGGIRRSAVGHYASEIGGVCSTPSVEGGLTDVLRSLKDLLSKDSDPPGDTGDPDDGTGDTEDSGGGDEETGGPTNTGPTTTVIPAGGRMPSTPIFGDGPAIADTSDPYARLVHSRGLNPFDVCDCGQLKKLDAPPKCKKKRGGVK